MANWLKRAVGALPGSPFFMLHAIVSLPAAQRLIWLEALASTVGQAQRLQAIHPQQYLRFNDLLDMISADRNLRMRLIECVRRPQPIRHRLPALDAFFSLAIHLGHPQSDLQPRYHRHLLQIAHAQGFSTATLARFYDRHGVEVVAYQQACSALGCHWLSLEEALVSAFRKKRSRLHPDHQGDAEDFMHLERLRKSLQLP